MTNGYNTIVRGATAEYETLTSKVIELQSKPEPVVEWAPAVNLDELEETIRQAIRRTHAYSREKVSLVGWALRARVAGHCLASWLNHSSNTVNVFNLAIAVADLAPTLETQKACLVLSNHIQYLQRHSKMTNRQADKLLGQWKALQAKAQAIA